MMRNLAYAFLLIVLSPGLYAAEVTKVKGKGVLIELRGDPAVTGDNFYVVSPDGKRRGLVKIKKVKGEKAIGTLVKGKASPGYTLEFKQQKTGGSKASSGGAKMAAPSMDDGSAAGARSYWGALFGFAMDSMAVQVTSAPPASTNLGVVNMSGTGFSAKGLFDYELFSQIWFRGTTGIEMFNASGEAKCGPSNTDACTAKLMYLTFDFIGRYVFGSGSFRPWVGGGLGLLFPASKDATALDPASISTTNVMIITGGFDWFTSPTFYVPVSIEYGLLPKSDEVEATWIAVRAGFAVPF